MKLHLNFIQLLFFSVMIISYSACRQPATKLKQPVNKLMLLQLIKKLVVIENRTPGQGIALLRSFAQNHDLHMISSNQKFKDTTVLQARFNPNKDFPCYYFNLPANFQKQLTYHDLDLAYWKGIESPRPKEPLSFSIMYHVKGGGNIAIMTTSQFPPPVARPMIGRITVML